jgi:CubicO group peptidase (beta-lactamase class C family)
MPSQSHLLPRSTPAASGLSSRSIGRLLDWLEAHSSETHSIMVVRRGHVVAEGWWSPYSADRPHHLYSLTKSFTSVAVGLAIADGLLSLDDRLVDVLPDHVPSEVSEQGRRITVHHLLSMTAGHATDTLLDAWELEPDDLVKGFLRIPFASVEGSRHTYDNATTFILARMVERVSGRRLEDLLDERLFVPMGIDHAVWDRVASGVAFGFQGLHLTTEAVAAFGELLRRGGAWGDRQLVPREYVERATSRQVDVVAPEGEAPSSARGYGYQFWMSRHGFYGDGAFSQQCVVYPSLDLVVALTSANVATSEIPDGIWECLQPGVDHSDRPEEDEILADRLRRLALPPVGGSAAPGRSITARLDASVADSALPEGTTVVVAPTDGGWRVRFESILDVEVGHGEWRESSPLGRPVVATGGWQDNTFVADLYVITSPHRVRLTVDADAASAVARWSTAPLTKPSLELHLRSPLMTRPDVA